LKESKKVSFKNGKPTPVGDAQTNFLQSDRSEACPAGRFLCCSSCFSQLSFRMDIEIRNCTAADFEDVKKLLQQLWPDRHSNEKDLQEVYHRALNTSQQTLMVAVDADKVVGFCSLTIKNNLWQAGILGVIDELIVDSQYRSFGIGKMNSNCK
jgi:hypothetical protein